MLNNLARQPGLPKGAGPPHTAHTQGLEEQPHFFMSPLGKLRPWQIPGKPAKSCAITRLPS
jgi:hypothetical protein